MAEEKKQVTDAEMDAMFAALRSKESDETQPENRAFLNSLTSIPDMHAQSQATPSAGQAGWSIGDLVERWLSPDRLFSARGLVSQAAFASVLLISGIVTGLEVADEPLAFDDYDVSASLFGDEDADYSIDG